MLLASSEGSLDVLHGREGGGSRLLPQGSLRYIRTVHEYKEDVGKGTQTHLSGFQKPLPGPGHLLKRCGKRICFSAGKDHGQAGASSREEEGSPSSGLRCHMVQLPSSGPCPGTHCGPWTLQALDTTGLGGLGSAYLQWVCFSGWF